MSRFQLFSYQLNDTIPLIGIAEHCSFTSYGGAALQIGLAEGCSCWDERLYYSYSIRQYGLKWGSSFLMPLVLISCSLCEILASICESTNLNPFNATGSVQFAGLKIGNWTYNNSRSRPRVLRATAFSQDYNHYIIAIASMSSATTFLVVFVLLAAAITITAAVYACSVRNRFVTVGVQGGRSGGAQFVSMDLTSKNYGC